MISRRVSIITAFYLALIFVFSCTSDIKKESPSSASSDSLTANDSPVSNNSATQSDARFQIQKFHPLHWKMQKVLQGSITTSRTN
jgi:hypothetical protein